MKCVVAALAVLGCNTPPGRYDAATAPTSSFVREPATDEAPHTRVRSSAAGAPTDNLVVTHGAIERERGRVVVRDASVRAELAGSSGDVGELDFIYLGPTGDRSALASGTERDQLGLKLRAQDSCNVIYVMWRLDPAALIVQVKHNTGQRVGAECSNHGYQRVRPTQSLPPPTLSSGAHHRLAAAITGDELEVRIDDNVHWRGRLPAEARELAGRVGFRTDNVALDLALTGDAAR